MSRLQRERGALLSGFARTTIAVPALPGTVVLTQLPIPIGNPMDHAGYQRNAPMPFLSLWAGLRPDVDFSMPTIGGVTTFFEVGLIPYTKNPSDPVARSVRPLFAPFNGVSSGPFTDTLGMRTLLPWPPGGLVVRVSFEYQNPNPLGTNIDFCAAWTVNSQSAFGNLPALQDTRDL